jgi:hypothetical protein
MRSKEICPPTERKVLRLSGTANARNCLLALETAESQIELMEEKLNQAKMEIERLDKQLSKT